MSATSDESRVETLAEEFIERKRRGEKVSVDQYVEQYPGLAEPIRDTFGALALMEDLAPSPDESLGMATVMIAPSGEAPGVRNFAGRWRAALLVLYC